MSNEYLKIDNQLCFRLYSTSRKMTRLYQPFLEKFNLTYPQYIVMLVMFEHQEIDFKDLSTDNFSESTISPLEIILSPLFTKPLKKDIFPKRLFLFKSVFNSSNIKLGNRLNLIIESNKIESVEYQMQWTQI